LTHGRQLFLKNILFCGQSSSPFGLGVIKSEQNGALFGAPKSGTSVSAAGVNAHRELGKPGTISLQRNQRRGKQGTRHAGEFQ